MAKLFVSYSRKDSAAARKLIEAFKSIEQDVWVDWESIPPAVDWLEQIFRGIEESDAFIFLISPDSIASEVCKVELARAAQNNKRIIPIVLRDVDPNITPESIRKLNWTFIRRKDIFEEGLAKVKTAIELDLDWLEEHRRLQVRALEWHRKKDPSLLLHGRDLRNARHMVATATSKDPIPTELQITFILHSQKNDRNRTIAWISAGIALLIMAVLSLIAVNNANAAEIQRDIAATNAEAANINAIQADENRKQAEENERMAQRNEQQAIEARKAAEDAETLAEAQRSVARAQINQARPGELDTSTLLAIDSWQRSPSAQAEEILRKNISLLPIPIAQATQSGTINSLEFNPEGTRFLTASDDGTACMWNAEDGKKLFCATSPEAVNDATFNPNGEFIVTGDQSGLVQILAAESGNVENEFELGVAVQDVSIRRDGALLAVARENGKITIIDLKAREVSYSLQTSGIPVVSTFSPNGSWLAAGTNTGSVTIWNLSDGRVIAGPHHKDGVLALAFSPNSRFIVTGGKDSAAKVAETRSGTVLLQIANEDWVNDIAFGPDGLWFVTASNDRRIRVWSTDSGRERLRILQDGIVTKVKVSANGQWIATTGLDQTVRVWNSATGAEIVRIPLNAGGSALNFNQEGNSIVVGDQSGAINVWDISSVAAPLRFMLFSGTAGSVQFSPSGNRLAASDENRVWLLNPEPLSNLTPYPVGGPTLEFKSKVKQITFSPDSKYLGVATEGNEVVIYNIEARNVRPIGPSGLVQALAFSPDSLQFITAGSDGRVQAWDVDSGQFINNLVEENSSVLSLSASPEFLGANLTDRIVILGWGDGVSEIESSAGYTLLAFSADGSLLAAGTSSGQIDLWKYQNEAFERSASLDKEQAVSMSFNSDQSLLAVGTAGNAYLIDTASGEEIARIPHIGIVNGVSFSADGKILATASSKALQFWDIGTIPQVRKNDLISTACARLIQNFDTAQWTALFGNEPYRILCENLPAPE